MHYRFLTTRNQIHESAINHGNHGKVQKKMGLNFCNIFFLFFFTSSRVITLYLTILYDRFIRANMLRSLVSYNFVIGESV